ncbi:hypothetical protein ACWF9B_00920 [Streptomyces sp. NPDC055089]
MDPFLFAEQGISSVRVELTDIGAPAALLEIAGEQPVLYLSPHQSADEALERAWSTMRGTGIARAEIELLVAFHWPTETP